jgi:hypothetical protein
MPRRDCHKSKDRPLLNIKKKDKMKEMIRTLKQAYVENPKDFLWSLALTLAVFGVMGIVLILGSILEGKI